MNDQERALRLADKYAEAFHDHQRHASHETRHDMLVFRDALDAELRRLHHNNQVLKDALWRACGDDEETVNATIACEGELK